MTGVTKKLKKEGQVQSLPMNSDDSGFTWYMRKYCELKCEDCGITKRFDTNSICNCEFECKDESGLEIAVVVKAKTYCDQIRSGGFQ